MPMTDRTVPSAPRAVIATLGFFLFTIVGGALVAALAARFATDWPERDLVRLARRCMMLTGLLGLPFYLRALGSRGLGDAGWGGPRRVALRALGLGMVVGLLSLLPLVVLSLWTGTRHWHPVHGLAGTLARAAGYALSAAVVGVSEEILVRGFLFLALRRAMGTAGAALLSGAVFGWAHFVEPAVEALRAPGLLSAALAIAGSGLAHIAGEEFAAARFFNLLLMSTALCVAVARTGTVWLAAGLHAGWVWVKKMNAILSDSVTEHPLQAAVGCRSDYLDSWGCTALLLILTLALALAPRPSQGVSTAS